MKFHIATKDDKSRITSFYRQQRYSAGFIGNDHGYFVTLNSQMVACLIISTINTTHWLHGLVVANEHQKQGIASQLLDFALRCISGNELYCFAQNTLTPFYIKQNFQLIPSDLLPDLLLARYSNYLKKQPSLVSFCRSN